MKRLSQLLRPLLLLLFGIVTGVTSLSASPIDEAEARAVAEQWWRTQRSSRSNTEKLPIRLTASYAAGYRYECGEDFLLVGGEVQSPLILGYGSSAQSSALPPPPPLQAALGHPVTVYPPEGAEYTPVDPLLTTIRHQLDPYNRACPYYLDAQGHPSTERCQVGCVATAMEQVLTYYRRQYVLKDTLKGWRTAHYTIADILPGTAVDTRLIREDYADGTASEAEIDAVARLSYYLGVAAHMNWGLSASGAQTVRLIAPLKQAFGLPYVHYLDSYKYAPTDYWNFIASEIVAHRPVYYAGYLMTTGGHAFVLDGIDERGLIHVNWGYGGNYDGYYRLDVLFHPQQESDRLTEFDEGGFFCNQEALALCPDPVTNAILPDTLPRTGREVEIEAIRLLQQPVTGCYTAVQLFVHNTTSETLTT
ncbi:MAG: C10 family peptidase, partial [Rothia sp. (in: high G+C Gram-positive bacteria)]|uniref:C10 family peptidase n=1 Tax=Rothia sp. (in: high G+C Gram-positive bacteria) TaxID=1885016 RepID=UPI0026DF0198